MPNEKSEKIDKEVKQPQALERVEGDEALEAEAEGVEGRVAEIAKTSAGEKAITDKKGTSTQITPAEEEKNLQERAVLREQLLKNAPPMREMRQEITKELTTQKIKLESDYREFKRHKDYHMLSSALSQLRKVIREMNEVAKAGLEALKELWLRIVHKFS